MLVSQSHELGAYVNLVKAMVSEVGEGTSGVAVEEFDFPDALTEAFDAVSLYMAGRSLRNTAPKDQPKAEFGGARTDGLGRFLPDRKKLICATAQVRAMTTAAVRNVLGQDTVEDSLAYNRHEPGATGERHNDPRIKVAVTLMRGGACIEFADDLDVWEQQGPQVAEIENTGLLVVKGSRLKSEQGPRAPFHQVSERTNNHSRESVPLVYY